MREYLNISNECNLELMKRYSDNYFDLAIVDPPYGIGWDKENTTMSAGERKDGTQRKMKTWNNPKPKKYKKGNWDNDIPSEEYFIELQRVSKFQVIWGGNYFTEHLKPSGGWIVWEKGVPDGMSLSQAELAWNNVLNSIKVTKQLWAGYKKCESSERIHPTQKPIKLYEWVLSNYAKEGYKILDTHLGSGSIAIAVDSMNKIEKMNLTLTACELDKDYYKDTINRIETETKWNSLF